MFSSLKGLSLPITSKLDPRNRANLLYMAETAVLTRLAIAGMRTWQNAPSKNKNPDASMQEKYNSLTERLFIEILGTSGYMLAMHFGSDMLAKAMEARDSLNPKKMLESLKDVSPEEWKVVKDAVFKVYGENPQGIIARVLYGKANLSNLAQALSPSKLMENPAVRTHLEQFATKLNRAGSMAILSGIGTGVLFGGVIVQWLNDRFIGPVVEPFLARIFGWEGKSSQTTPGQEQNGWQVNAGKKKFPQRPVQLTEVQRTFRC